MDIPRTGGQILLCKEHDKTLLHSIPEVKTRRTLLESQKADLEKDFLPVDSDYFDHVIYAVDRKGKGMYIIIGKVKIPIDADNIMPFAAEICAVWDTMKPRKGE